MNKDIIEEVYLIWQAIKAPFVGLGFNKEKLVISFEPVIVGGLIMSIRKPHIRLQEGERFIVAQRQSFKVKTDTVHVEHRYLTVKECAEFTGISVKTLYRWSREEKMPNRKIGHILRFDRAEIEKWIDRFKGGDTNVDLLDC